MVAPKNCHLRATAKYTRTQSAALRPLKERHLSKSRSCNCLNGQEKKSQHYRSGTQSGEGKKTISLNCTTFTLCLLSVPFSPSFLLTAISLFQVFPLPLLYFQYPVNFLFPFPLKQAHSQSIFSGPSKSKMVIRGGKRIVKTELVRSARQLSNLISRISFPFQHLHKAGQ